MPRNERTHRIFPVGLAFPPVRGPGVNETFCPGPAFFSPWCGMARVGLPLPKGEGGPPGERQARGAPEVTRSGAGT